MVAVASDVEPLPAVAEELLERVMEFRRRMAVAQEVLGLFASGTRLEWRPGRGMFVVWRRWGLDDEVARRWQTSGGQEFYPVWKRQWHHGGTCSTALSQLIRWVQGRPVMPLSSWRWWTGPQVRLGREQGPKILELLRAGGYPETAVCVKCGKAITERLDWGNRGRVAGPICGNMTGCRHREEPTPELE